MSPTPARGASLRVAGLARRFGPRWILQGVSFELPPGRAAVLVGPNGSGKTTLLRCLATALRPHAGSVAVDGHDLWRDRNALRPRIGFLSHATRLYEDLSAQDNLHTWAALGRTPIDAAALLKRVGLSASRRDPVRTFSAGMKRRLALAVALIRPPDLMLLDEPLASLDAAGRDLVVDVIRELRGAGVTIVVASHLPAVMKPLVDDALRLDAGRLVWSGPAADLEVA